MNGSRSALGGKSQRRSLVVELEQPAEAVERLFGAKLVGVYDFQVRGLLIALWPLGPESAQRRANEFVQAALEGCRRAHRPLTHEGLRELGVAGPVGCPDWFMETPISLALAAADRAESLIRWFITRAAHPWAQREGWVWCVGRKVRT